MFDTVNRSAQLGRANAQRDAQPVAAGRRVGFIEQPIDQRAKYGLRRSDLAHCERKRQISRMQQAQRGCGALMLKQTEARYSGKRAKHDGKA